MRGVKGTDLLARAVFEVAAGLRGAEGGGDGRPGPPGVRLVLKGLDALYESQQWLRLSLVGVTPLGGSDDGPVSKAGSLAEAMRAQVARGALRVEYIGGDLPVGDLAARMQAADVYAHLYRAEGFALPVLQAAGSGLPLVVTAGAPPDDLVTDLFALRVPAERVAAKGGHAASPPGTAAEFLEASRGEFLVPVPQPCGWRRCGSQSRTTPGGRLLAGQLPSGCGRGGSRGTTSHGHTSSCLKKSFRALFCRHSTYVVRNCIIATAAMDSKPCVSMMMR
jgi:hypothetical protein